MAHGSLHFFSAILTDRQRSPSNACPVNEACILSGRQRGVYATPRTIEAAAGCEDIRSVRKLIFFIPFFPHPGCHSNSPPPPPVAQVYANKHCRMPNERVQRGCIWQSSGDGGAGKYPGIEWCWMLRRTCRECLSECWQQVAAAH